MKRLESFLLVTIFALGCKPEAHKMSTVPVGPPTFRTIPAGANPNTLGISGAYGDIVQNSGGLGSWVLGALGWQTFPGTNTADGGVPLSAPVANASLATMSGQTVKGNAGTDAAVPADLTKTQLTALINPANPDAGGIMSAAVAAGLTGGIAAAVYTSGKINITTTAASQPLIPARAGFYFLAIRYTVYLMTGSGTATGSLVWSVGNNSTTQTNIITSQTVSTAVINAAVSAGLPQAIALNNASGVLPLADMATSGSLNISTGATGLTSGTAYFSVYGTWVPTS